MPSADVIPISPGFIKAHSPLPPVNAYAGIICQSATTGHACFWDNKLRDDGTPQEEVIGWKGQRLVISELKDGSNLAGGPEACTSCHRGNNVFLIMPDDPTWARLLRGPLEGPNTGAFTTRIENPNVARYIPITTLPPRKDWPENLASAGGCAGGCHETPLDAFPFQKVFELVPTLPPNELMPPRCASPSVDDCYGTP